MYNKGGANKKVSKWSLEWNPYPNMREILINDKEKIEEHENEINCVRINPTQSMAISCGDDLKIIFWKI